MSTLPYNFDLYLPCEDCGSEFEAHIEGRYYSDGVYHIEQATNLFNKKVFNPNPEQGSIITQRAVDYYPDAVQELKDAENARRIEEKRLG
jgi:hypothetical protein